MEAGITLPSASGDEEIHVGIKVTEGLGDVSAFLILLGLY